MNETAPLEDPRVSAQLALLQRGVHDLISRTELAAALTKSMATGRPLRVKLGVDPTSASLHLGFTLGLRKLRQFQDLGHQAVLIIGDATAMVGDPTGRNKARPRLDASTVDAHAKHYLEQACRILNRETLEVRRNGEWLKALDFSSFIELASRSTVARMLERDDFQKRWKEGTAIQLHEFLYPLLQGQDSVAVQADVELGGRDQLFNLLVGRDLQQQHGQTPQVCMTTPLLIGTDGVRKMSKSYDNHVGIDESADDMILKVMRINDAMLRDWMLHLTRFDDAQIEALLGAGTNPRDAKLALGKSIVADYHGAEAADQAAEGWLRRVSRKETDESLALLVVPSAWAGQDISVLELLMHSGWFASKGEARRQLEQGAVNIGAERISGHQAHATLHGGEVLRVGRQRSARISFS